MPFGGGGGGGGLTSVDTDTTLNGNGTVATPLSVAVPYTPAAPGALGGTISNTGQFTELAVGASVPALPGAAGDVVAAGSIMSGGQAAPANPGDCIVSRPGANAIGLLYLGVGIEQSYIFATLDNGGYHVVLLNNNNRFSYNWMQPATPDTYAHVVAAAGTPEGALAAITDSTTATWGATIAGGGAHHVLAYCDGTNWTVAAI